jgi:hypothetical protein
MEKTIVSDGFKGTSPQIEKMLTFDTSKGLIFRPSRSSPKISTGLPNITGTV